jgi:hypothetical protein
MKDIKTKQQRYDEKNGLIPKTYKLHERIVIDFKKACVKSNISQGTQLEKLMLSFIREVDDSYDDY